MGSQLSWALVLSFLFGVFLRSLFGISWPVAAAFFLCGIALSAYGRTGPKRTALVFIVAACACGTGAGIIRADSAALSGDPAVVAHLDETVHATGIVVADPDARGSSTRITADLDFQFENATRIARVLVVAPPHVLVRYGDEISVSGALEAPQPFDTGTGRQFDYPMYLAKDGILYELDYAKVETTGKNGGFLPKSFALGVKHLLVDGLDRALPEPEAGLAAGIVLGDKHSVGTELSNAFTRASLIHMVVLSGYNITIVLNAAQGVAAYLPRMFRLGVAGLVVTFFILMTGGAATAVRAGIMALVAVYARMSGRVFLPLRALALVCAGMIAYRPLTLAYDPSFQLSALATFGLIAFTPVVSRHLGRIPERFGLREIVASTCATQLAVVPLLLYESGNLSLVALPANLLALVAAPLAMAFSFIASLAGLLAGPIAPLFALPAYAVLAYVIGIAQFFANIPFAALSIPPFSGWWLVPVYGALLMLWRWFEIREELAIAR